MLHQGSNQGAAEAGLKDHRHRGIFNLTKHIFTQFASLKKKKTQ